MLLLRPPEVRQPVGSVQCWAAALESWLKVTWEPTNVLGMARWSVKMDQLVKIYVCNTKELCSGAADTTMFTGTIAKDVGMETEIREEKKLQSLYVSSVLKKGHMYLAYQPPGHFTHCVVAYALTFHKNEVLASGAEEFFLQIMDPAHGHIERPLSFYDGAKMVVGWPKPVEQ